ncbi:MAG TPA: flagellar biosynthesis protein FlhB [Nitrospirae bacterium]|nr:flagellar biosynthetic protein FlhB [bacterium BMS3Abin06]HDH13226.1 flagellar biosynthesis protein FlhB [Nitrospirota bacterium]HDZ01806.1 flagellar biosynthesis protein FlhB [Nitrospirota bacterium]
MADDSFQEKTEQATSQKKQKAKDKGQVARSRDLTSMFAMGGIVMIFYFGGKYFFINLADMMGGILSFRYGSNPTHVTGIAVLQGMQILAPFFLVSLVSVIFISVVQGGFVKKEIKIEIEKLNPVEGIKKLFSIKGLTELLKSMLKFSVGGWITYYIIKKDMKVLPTLSAMATNDMIRMSGKLIMDAIITAFFYFMVIAIISYFLEKWQFERSLRMTKQEIKEEQKEIDGDPLIKSRIRSIQREAARKRMMQEVPKATVVITNPQHLAIAIKYVDKEMSAPKIVAKGAGVIAAKIKEIAAENGVPVVEDKPVARALFKLELNAFIPQELYVAVARVLAYIYKLKGRI